ncbi:hypothetical protein K435DRAFT_856029 [Dendrothele bispora CBS 962.96]|uniref:Cytochrome P450 n=1 Tax=Dendrothele bispora (strain CBS 962.96) TaxID=1314807 RepID=A0A4S8MA54_DENBC|nr:hypothetical protein K435DRAFT_856029 [Dendrothele bispora CBS 962.96]
MNAVIGDGLLVIEGEKHKLQRKVMNPAFGPAQIREFMDIFLEKSFQVRDIWTDQIDKSDRTDSEIDVLSWFVKATMDIIGVAGFNQQLNTLSGQDQKNRTEFHDFLDMIFHMARASKMNVWRILQVYIPALRVFTARSRSPHHSIRDAKSTMMRMGQQLIEETKRFQAGTGGKGHSIQEGVK